ncbi:RDD family protein [Saccharopolyspora sp. MS10]|uniref:RDD family protein n=1 Tax=Saccharopolyspora sp. MS10 TaxID=3385973 RepID=UPI0039A18B79
MVPTGVEQQEEPATGANDGTTYFRKRFGQILLDAALIALTTFVLLPISLLLGVFLIMSGVDGTLAMSIGFGIFLTLIMPITWWWHVWVPYRRGGSTFSMGWLKLRIVSLDGQPASLGQHHARWILSAADSLFFGLVGIVLIVATPQHQRLGDVVARTRVARTDVG